MRNDFRDTARAFIFGANAVLDEMGEQFRSAVTNAAESSREALSRLAPYSRKDTDTETILEFNFAGYEKENIKVRIDETNHILTVIATKDDTKDFTRIFNLPRSTKTKDIKSSYKTGLLTISIKKAVSKDTAKDINIE